MLYLLLQVALHFVELYFSSEQQRIFDVQISANGQMTQALTNFDIYYAAGEVVLSAHKVSPIEIIRQCSCVPCSWRGYLPQSTYKCMLEKQVCPWGAQVL